MTYFKTAHGWQHFIDGELYNISNEEMARRMQAICMLVSEKSSITIEFSK